MKRNELKLPEGLLITGIILRIVTFAINLIVGGHNCDEVMTSLNAFSLADRMTDINGERLPVYFDTWVIGGQSPFATYLTALSVKLLGHNIFAVRLPALIFSILGLVALYYFSKEIFRDNKYISALVGLGAVSPWMLYSGAYVLDCNYLGHLLIFAFLFLAMAVNSSKTKYYVLSMVFFSLCFYCYIASVLLIPFLLLAFYMILIIKKRISVKNVVISVITVAIVAVPFILWGLVVIEAIPEFSVLGFNFSRMSDYARGSDTVFATGGIAEIITNMLMNLMSVMVLLLINDYSAVAPASNLFPYGLFLSGFIALIGFVIILFALLKKKKLPFSVKLFSAGSLCGIIAFSAFINEPHLGSLYRYGILSYMLILIEAIGLVGIIDILKKVNFNKALCIYLALSVMVFTGVFAFSYLPQVRTGTMTDLGQENYGDPFFEGMDFAKKNGYSDVTVYRSSKAAINTAAYERYYIYGEKAFYSIENEIKNTDTNRDENGYYLVTEDGAVKYMWIKENNELENDFCIAETDNVEALSFDKEEYTTKSFGYWTAIYKERKQ